MEKVRFENERGVKLVGNFWDAESDRGVVMAHGFAGYKEEKNGKFNDIGQDLNDSGFNVLAFDFSGCGESEDDTISVEKEVEDLRAAVEFMESEGITHLGALGVSNGGLVALRNHSDFEAMVLMAPQTDGLREYREERMSEKQRQELREQGFFIKMRENRSREKHVITEEAIKYKESFDQEDLLQGVNLPVLIVHGIEDDIVPVEDSRKAVEKLKDSRLVEVRDNHYFDNSVEQITEVSIEWFEKYIS
jgi:esterase/lipase